MQVALSGEVRRLLQDIRNVRFPLIADIAASPSSLHRRVVIWFLIIAPAAGLGFFIGNVYAVRWRRALFASLLALPIIILGSMLVYAFGLTSDTMVGLSMAAPLIAAWMAAAGLSYFATRRLAA